MWGLKTALISLVAFGFKFMGAITKVPLFFQAMRASSMLMIAASVQVIASLASCGYGQTGIEMDYAYFLGLKNCYIFIDSRHFSVFCAFAHLFFFLGFSISGSLLYLSFPI
jgi:hypothetical protein